MIRKIMKGQLGKDENIFLTEKQEGFFLYFSGAFLAKRSRYAEYY